MGKAELEPAYRSILKEELRERQKRNELYSLRAFARSLKISPTMLSQILQGKRSITQQTATKIADALPLSQEDRRKFLKSIFLSRDLTQSSNEWQSHFVDVQVDDFQFVADPVHLAILALEAIHGSRWNAEWIASQLDIEKADAQEAMTRLLNLDLVQIEPDGQSFKQKTPPIRMRSPQKAIQAHHVNTLKKALDSLLNDPAEDREFNVITMAISKKKLEMARELTQRYLENIHSLLDDKEEKDRVYTIALQIFPVSKA